MYQKEHHHSLTNVSLDNREVVLQGDHEIKQTLRVSHVTGYWSCCASVSARWGSARICGEN